MPAILADFFKLFICDWVVGLGRVNFSCPSPPWMHHRYLSALLLLKQLLSERCYNENAFFESFSRATTFLKNQFQASNLIGWTEFNRSVVEWIERPLLKH